MLVYATTTTATQVIQTNDELLVWLENEVKVTYPTKPCLKTRLTAFFIKHSVHHPTYYADIIMKEDMTNAERKLFAAILVPETRGKVNAVSSEGAVGPWQQHPFWFKRFGKATHPKKNLSVCLKIYRIHREESKNVSEALLAYSGGSRWYPRKVKALMSEI